MDLGEKYTYKLTAQMERRLAKEYKQAEKEIQEKMEAWFAQFEKQDKQWKELVDKGEKTQTEYAEWRKSKYLFGKKWTEQKESIAQELLKLRTSTMKETRKMLPEIMAANYNFATYQVEHDGGINTSFALMNKEAVESIVRENPNMLPPPKDPAKYSAKLLKRYKITMQSCMIQGIMQGESIPKLAKRIAERTGEQDRKAAVRNARTAATAAQNKGRSDAYKRAQSKGVEMEKMWLATMDNRTRHSHRWLDEERQPLDGTFSNGCEYPGDPKGDPAEVYNCRCSMRAIVKGLERNAASAFKDGEVAGMSYEEWRDARPVYRRKKK